MTTLSRRRNEKQIYSILCKVILAVASQADKLQKRTFLQHSCRDTNRQNMVKPPETTNWNHHPERTHKSMQSPEPVHREHAHYLRPPLALWRNTDSRWSPRLKPTSHSQTITLSLFHRKLLYPRGFSFLLPSPLFPVFFQQQPLFHSWELWPFKEKGSVCLFGLLWRVCLCVCVYCCSLIITLTKAWRKFAKNVNFLARFCFVSRTTAWKQQDTILYVLWATDGYIISSNLCLRCSRRIHTSTSMLLKFSIIW